MIIYNPQENAIQCGFWTATGGTSVSPRRVRQAGCRGWAGWAHVFLDSSFFFGMSEFIVTDFGAPRAWRALPPSANARSRRAFSARCNAQGGGSSRADPGRFEYVLYAKPFTNESGSMVLQQES